MDNVYLKTVRLVETFYDEETDTTLPKGFTAQVVSTSGIGENYDKNIDVVQLRGIPHTWVPTRLLEVLNNETDS